MDGILKYYRIMFRIKYGQPSSIGPNDASIGLVDLVDLINFAAFVMEIVLQDT